MKRIFLSLLFCFFIFTSCANANSVVDSSQTTAPPITENSTPYTTEPPPVFTTAPTPAESTTESTTTTPETEPPPPPPPPEPLVFGDVFELPINGATGYASISLKLYEEPNNTSNSIKTLSASTHFRIIEEVGDFWYVKTDEDKGYIQHKYCFINLPDVIPSIIYDNTNAYASIFMSSSYPLPSITGEQLYSSKSYNERLRREEFVMPVIYEMAKKISHAQKNALAEGNSLKIYEAFRPYTTQSDVKNSLIALSNENEEVCAGLSIKPWHLGWFISTSYSNHQRGVAIDTSLVEVVSSECEFLGNYSFTTIYEYNEYPMQSQMHELSCLATLYKYPIASEDYYVWENTPFANTITEGAILLQKYCTEVGLYPLASEWWHFNDLHAKYNLGENLSNGKFFLSKQVSVSPEFANDE